MAGADYILGGPIFWFMVILQVLAGMLAASVMLHASLVARRGRLAKKPGSVWLWAGPQAGYLVLLFMVSTRLLPSIAAAVLFLSTPLILIQSIAYLLRVVFPKPLEPSSDVLLGDETTEPSVQPANSAGVASRDKISPPPAE